MKPAYSIKKAYNPSLNPFRNSRSQHHQKIRKNFNFTELQSIRVLNPCLIICQNIPAFLNQKKLLKSKKYFGRYGNVVRMVIYTHSEKQPQKLWIYVTYTNQFDAALAIKAIDGFTIFDCQLKAFYGTDKYCQNFLRKEECENQNCFYLHEFNYEYERYNIYDIKESQKIKLKQVFFNHLGKLCEKQFSDYEIRDINEFCLIGQLIRNLIAKGQIQEQGFEKILKKTKKRLKFKTSFTDQKNSEETAPSKIEKETIKQQINFIVKENEDLFEKLQIFQPFEQESQKYEDPYDKFKTTPEIERQQKLMKFQRKIEKRLIEILQKKKKNSSFKFAISLCAPEVERKMALETVQTRNRMLKILKK